MPQGITDPGGFGVEAYEPAPIPIFDPGERLDPDFGLKQVPDSDLDDARERLAGSRIRAYGERHSKGIRAAPIGPRVIVAQDIELGGRLSAQYGYEGRWGHALFLRADDLRIGQQHSAVVERHSLR